MMNKMSMTIEQADDGSYVLLSAPKDENRMVLRYPVVFFKSGRHNASTVRHDYWFNGPGGFVWHGVQYGSRSNVVHAKRTIRKSKNG